MMRAKAVFAVVLFLAVGCDGPLAGPPYAFRLAVPPSPEPLFAHVVPYYWWTELAVYDTFTKCAEERSQMRQMKEDSIGVLMLCRGCDEKQRKDIARRLRLADCVPLR
jgi:hypothetical protein